MYECTPTHTYTHLRIYSLKVEYIYTLKVEFFSLTPRHSKVAFQRSVLLESPLHTHTFTRTHARTHTHIHKECPFQHAPFMCACVLCVCVCVYIYVSVQKRVSFLKHP
jgi:hypothetical protein